MRDRCRQCSEARDSGHVCKLRSEFAERLFRESALRHVLNRADVLQLTILVSARVNNSVQVFDRVVVHLCPVVHLKVSAIASRPVDMLGNMSDVIRVEPRTESLHRDGHSRVKPGNVINLL